MAQINNSSETRVVVDGSAFATFFEQKIQKVSHALYMVTSYVPEGEPLRYSIRRVALDMVDALHENDLFGGASVRVSFEPLFRQVVSFLSIAKTMGYISQMNADILSSEITSLANLVTEDSASSHGLLSREFFAVPTSYPERGQRNQLDTHKPAISETYSTTPVPTGSSETGNVNVNTNKTYQGQHNDVRDNKLHSLRTNAPAMTKKDISIKKTHVSRREKILDLFNQGKDSITVNDVEKAVQGCSKKTMQRELFSLVEEGILEKEGEKRWSEYRMVRRD